MGVENLNIYKRTLGLDYYHNNSRMEGPDKSAI